MLKKKNPFFLVNHTCSQTLRIAALTLTKIVIYSFGSPKGEKVQNLEFNKEILNNNQPFPETGLIHTTLGLHLPGFKPLMVEQYGYLGCKYSIGIPNLMLTREQLRECLPGHFVDHFVNDGTITLLNFGGREFAPFKYDLITHPAAVTKLNGALMGGFANSLNNTTTALLPYKPYKYTKEFEFEIETEEKIVTLPFSTKTQTHFFTSDEFSKYVDEHDISKEMAKSFNMSEAFFKETVSGMTPSIAAHLVCIGRGYFEETLVNGTVEGTKYLPVLENYTFTYES